MRHLESLSVLSLLLACTTTEAHPSPSLRSSARPVTTASGSTAPPGRGAPLPADAVYPWRPAAPTTDRLDVRFRDPPPGFVRVNAPAGSFGAFLRTLPLLPEGARVVDFRGNGLYDHGRHPNIVAVADLDVGRADLQHCADVILRLHAEWRYGRGERDLTYRSTSGQALSYRAYLAGDRAFLDGKKLAFRRAAGPRTDDHAALRAWLDEVFAWAATVSLERDAAKVPSIADVRAGDFFVMSGSPFGHAVLVLDVARDEHGRAALLLGQGYMPAQSFHVMRPGAEGRAWFVVEPGATGLATPFWRWFPMTSLRRLGGSPTYSGSTRAPWLDARSVE